MESVDSRFRFSTQRMLLIVALLGIWLGGLRVLSLPWALWLTTATFYLGIALLFVPRGIGRARPSDR